MDEVERTIRAALKTNRKNFEAIGLVVAGKQQIVALETTGKAKDDLVPALKRFLYRIAIDIDNIHELETVNNVIYYDLSERQVVCNLVRGEPESYILVIVTGPKKAYKRASKQLLKQLQTLIES